MNRKHTALAAALAAGLALGASQNASAYVYAASSLEVTNLVITLPGALPGSTITSFNARATNTATLNGNSATVGTGGTGAGAGKLSVSCTLATCSASSPRLDPGAANAPLGAPIRNNNDFSLFGTGTEFSNSDSVVYTAAIAGDLSTHTQQIAESNLTAGSGANANSEITSTTGFSLTFDTTTGGDIDLVFDADPYMRAAINTPNLVSATSQPNIAVTFTLQRSLASGGGKFTWSPDGAVTPTGCTGTIGTATCSELADPNTLNDGIPISSIDDITYDPTTGAYHLHISGLASGTYTLGLDALTSTDVSQTAIPEPGVLALMGAGLLAFASTRRRKTK